jgi:lysophospholipase L1-like esterase
MMFEPAQRALPVFVIGDSHALPYKNMLFRDKWTGKWVMTRSKYISGLTAYDFFNLERQEFSPSVIECLEYEGLIRDGRATHLSKEEIDFSIARASGLAVTPPLILFTIGDIDIRGVLLPMLGDHYDFVPPFELPYPLLDRQIIPWDMIAELIERRLSPFVEGLRQLRVAGFNRIYVQLVVPPTTDEDRIRQVHGISCPLPVRTKLVASFNRILAESMKAIEVPIVDIWPQVTGNDGYLLGEYELDGVHLPPKAAKMQLEQLLQHAINCQWESVNHVRYEMFYRMACGLAPIEKQTGDVS